MANLTTYDVLKLAQLSKLELSKDELIEFTKEVNEILKYVEQLQKVDTTNLEPTNQVNGLTNVMRKDEVVNYGVSKDELLKNLPNRQDDYIKVRRVL